MILVLCHIAMQCGRTRAYKVAQQIDIVVDPNPIVLTSGYGKTEISFSSSEKLNQYDSVLALIEIAGDTIKSIHVNNLPQELIINTDIKIPDSTSLYLRAVFYKNGILKSFDPLPIALVINE